MFKTLLLLFICLLTLLEPAAAAPPAADATRTEAALDLRIGRPNYRKGRPNYKRYRGNSRHKAKKLGPYRRWRLYRKAQRKRHGSPNIKVGTPTRSMSKK